MSCPEVDEYCNLSEELAMLISELQRPTTIGVLGLWKLPYAVVIRFCNNINTLRTNVIICLTENRTATEAIMLGRISLNQSEISSFPNEIQAYSLEELIQQRQYISRTIRAIQDSEKKIKVSRANPHIEALRMHDAIEEIIRDATIESLKQIENILSAEIRIRMTQQFRAEIRPDSQELRRLGTAFEQVRLPKTTTQARLSALLAAQIDASMRNRNAHYTYLDRSGKPEIRDGKVRITIVIESLNRLAENLGGPRVQIDYANQACMSQLEAKIRRALNLPGVPITPTQPIEAILDELDIRMELAGLQQGGQEPLLLARIA